MLVLAIIFDALAALFFASGSAVTLFAPPSAPPEARLIILGAVLGIGAVLWLIGAACVRFRDWMGHMGWTLVGAGGMGGLTLYSVGVMVMDPASRELLDSRTRAMMEHADLFLGGVATGVMLVLGALLVFLQSRKDKSRRAADSTSVTDVFN